MSFLAAVVGCFIHVGCVAAHAPDGPVATEAECKAIVTRDEPMVKKSLDGVDFFVMSCIEIPAGLDQPSTRDLIFKLLGPKKGAPI